VKIILKRFMEKRLVPVSSLKVGNFVVIDGAPCKIVEITTSAPGKHGAAKARIVGIGLIDKKKRETIRSTSDTIEAPVIKKKYGQIIMLTEDKAQIMDLETYETIEADIEENLKGKLTEGIEVEYWELMGYYIVKRIRKERI